MKKIVLIVGHSLKDSGAIAWNGVKEFEYNLSVAKRLEKEIGVQVVLRGSTGIAGAALKALSYKPDLIIEMHLNSFNKTAKGCEVLVLNGDNASAEYARKFATAFTTKFNRKIRGDQGVKWVNKKDRGGFSLSMLAPAPAAILIESFFCDNEAEWVSVEDYFQFMKEFICGL